MPVVEGGEHRAEGGASALGSDVAQDVGDVDRIGGPEAHAEDEARGGDHAAG